MIELETNVKEWGNSLGFILPKKLTKREKIKSGDKIKVIIMKDNNVLRETFGSLSKWKIDSQKVKDQLRKEWSKR